MEGAYGPLHLTKGGEMKRVAISFWALLALWLMAPQTSDAEIHRLSDEYLDSVHAQGLVVYLDYNIFVPNIDGTIDLNQVLSGAILPGATQTLGDGANGIQNGVQLNGNAQSNLNSLVNLNAANSAIPFGINITVINGDNTGTVNQSNTSTAILNSLLVWGGTL